MKNEIDAPLERAIAAAGGISALAKSLGLKSHSVVNQWRSKRVPSDYCPDIERLTGVPCEDLRPDVRWDVLRGNAAPQAAQGVAHG